MGSESNCKPTGLIVCGPCACGKSEIASALASHFNVPFVDADAYHSETNIEKMSNGIPLTDQDRFPWLKTVRQQMILQKKQDHITDSSVVVVAACSALKKIYRNVLSGIRPDDHNAKSDSDDLAIIFVFLNCSENVLQKRLNERQGHFMKANMLSSQLAVLEVPHEEATQGRAVVVNGDAELKEVIREAVNKLERLVSN